jgi:hypothetical protein
MTMFKCSWMGSLSPTFPATKMAMAKPIRSLKSALRYWYPKRLTLEHNPRIHAWLWWNF